MTSFFTTAYTDRADQIFLRPKTLYHWNDIVCGVRVMSPDGMFRPGLVSAVAMNTFRGFHRINKNCPGAQEAFRSYFIEEKGNLVHRIGKINVRSDLHDLQNQICADIKMRLANVRTQQLFSYNKIRKPVDLYIEHLVAMAIELDTQRTRLTPFLFLPLDSQIIQHPDLFAEEELKNHGLSRISTYKDVTSEATYLSLQSLLQKKANTIGNATQRRFEPIYFDLIWGNRYKNWGCNLFETIPLRQ